MGGLGVRGHRPAADVWADYVRPARWPAWSPQVRGVDLPAPAAPGAPTGSPPEVVVAGTRGTVRGPFGVRVAFVVTAVDHRSRSWRWVASCGGLDVGMEHAVVEVPGGCLTTLRVEGPLPVRVAYAPLARLALRRLVRG